MGKEVGGARIGEGAPGKRVTLGTDGGRRRRADVAVAAAAAASGGG
jgi:hypothetical protein